jgi:hypothetical protein
MSATLRQSPIGVVSVKSHRDVVITAELHGHSTVTLKNKSERLLNYWTRQWRAAILEMSVQETSMRS